MRRGPRMLSAAGMTLVATVGASPLTAADPAPAAPATKAAPAAPAASRSLETAIATTLSRLTTTSRYLRGYLSALVVDRESGRIVWAHQPGRRRAPASTQKLATALTVLRTLPAQTTFATRVWQHPTAPNVLILTGQGDPSLGSTRLRAVARVVAQRLLSEGLTGVQVFVDSSFFPPPTAPQGWKTTDLRSEVQYVRGLALAGYRGSDASLAAGRLFATHLTRAGLRATVRTRVVTPDGARQVAITSSAPVAQLVQRMLSVSDNDYAEFLLRHAAKANGAAASTTGAAAFQRRVLREAGVPLSGYLNYDGSGLSRADRMPPQTLLAAVSALYRNEQLRTIAFAYGAMPRAGQTGTLARRYRSRSQRCAIGRVAAKTGTLRDANALAGVGWGSDGRDRLFVLLDGGPTKTTAVRTALDALATTVVGCRL